MSPFHCTRCEGAGFLNLHQVDEATLMRFDDLHDPQVILDWMAANTEHDVAVCDCCGDGEVWLGTPGQHDRDNPLDPCGCR
jgi:hypothetical protein